MRPVAEMMPLAIAHAAAGEAAAPVPMVERSPQGGGNRPGPGPDLQQTSGVVVVHHHPACVARQAPGRSRGNVSGPTRPVRHAGPLVQGLARGRERLHEQRAHFRLEPPPEDHHAVLVLMDVKGPARMP